MAEAQRVGVAKHRVVKQLKRHGGRRPEGLEESLDQVTTLAAQWHPTQNDALRPEGVRPGSAKGVWWCCPKDPTHTWRARPLLVQWVMCKPLAIGSKQAN